MIRASSFRTYLLVVPLLLVATGCFADTNVTDSGKGLPEVTVEFPATAKAGETVTATFRIANPGPGDIAGLSVSWARVGNDFPIVDLGARRENDAVAGIDPNPLAVDASGVVYRFGGLKEGESVTISFDLVIPSQQGVVANSVVVSAVEDGERLQGLRLETTIE